MTIRYEKLWTKLRNRKYRKAFVATQVQRGVPFQIRAMRKKLGWTQQELADQSGLPQGSISRAEDLNYGKLSISTLVAIASGFDAALLIRIVPFSEAVGHFENLSEESVQAASFEEEDKALRAQFIPLQGQVATSKTPQGLLQHDASDSLWRILGPAIGSAPTRPTVFGVPPQGSPQEWIASPPMTP